MNRHGTRYVYYHCWRKRPAYERCPERAVQERAIDAAVAEFLTKMAPSERWVAEVLTIASTQEAVAQDADKARRLRLEANLRDLDTRLDRLDDRWLEGRINDDERNRTRSRYVAEQASLREALAKEDEGVLEPLSRELSWLNQAPKLFKHATAHEKREIVSRLTSNLVLKDRAVLITAKKPYSMYGFLSERPALRSWLDDVRTQLNAELDEKTSPPILHEHFSCVNQQISRGASAP